RQPCPGRAAARHQQHGRDSAYRPGRMKAPGKRLFAPTNSPHGQGVAMYFLFMVPGLVVGAFVGLVSVQVLFKRMGWLSDGKAVCFEETNRSKDWQLVQQLGAALGGIICGCGSGNAFYNERFTLAVVLFLTGGFALPLVVGIAVRLSGFVRTSVIPFA